MFWSGNYIVVRELNFLLKDENVTLSQVLEADDILQECKADNKALMQFLTRPDILAELITLVTAEPPAGVELAAQYRHASIACEVLTSPLSSLSDRLSLDTHQMNRLCDFINRDPPLNPLLASYFSKTIEMLLERNPKQDWYLYHIVCLRVLDFFKSRRDFLPNLLRHISTSAIADTFKYLIRLDDLFNKIVMEWLEEHQFIEGLIQIICGTYLPETGPSAGPSPEEPEKGTREPSEKQNHTGDGHTDDEAESPEHPPPPPPAPEARARTAAVASANACALLCDLVATGCAAEGAAARSRTALALAARLAGGAGVRALLQAVFTSAAGARAAALLHGARLLRQLLEHQPALGAEAGARSPVELAVAPHLPLLHQALLRDPSTYAQEEDGTAEIGAVEPRPEAVGAARIQVAALLAHLASSEVEEVPTTMMTLGTPGVLVDLFFRHPHNNFLHAQLLAFCRNALANPAYRTQYATHLLIECDLLTRLMDAFEENENRQSGGPRAGYMGHALLCLQALAAAPPAALAPAPAARWRAFAQDKLEPALHHFATPLGGTYPSETSYDLDSNISDRLTAYYDASAAGAGSADSAEFIADGLGLDDDDKMSATENRFLELANQRFDDDMWDEAPEGEGEGEAAPAALHDILEEDSPWAGGAAAPGGEGWAQFESLGGELAPADPFAHYWPYERAAHHGSSGLGGQLAARAEGCAALASNLLTAMSAMSAADLARIVGAEHGLQPPADLPPDGEGIENGDDRLDGGEAADAGVADTSLQVKVAKAVTDDDNNIIIAAAEAADAREKVPTASEAAAACPRVSEPAAGAPSSPDATGSIHSNASPDKESDSVGETPRETKDSNEITDKMDDVSLRDKSEDAAKVVDTEVLDASEAAEAPEAAER